MNIMHGKSMILDESESMQTSSIAAKNEYLKYLKAVKTKSFYIMNY